MLAEAALAGLPTLAPALGGSDSAFLSGITGLQPADHSVFALAAGLRSLVSSHSLRTNLGRNGRVWAEAAFNPESYRSEVFERLLGDTKLRRDVLAVDLRASSLCD